MPLLWILNLVGWKRAYDWLKLRPKTGDALSILLVSLIIVALFAAFFQFHDADVVDQHDAGPAVAVATGARNAEHARDADNAAVQFEIDAGRAAIKEAQAHAAAANPIDAHRPVGPITRATVDELRQRHAAGIR